MASFKDIALDAPVYVNFIIPENAGAVDAALFTSDGYYEVLEAREVHTVAGTDGSAVTLDLLKAASGTAFGSGTSVLASTFNLKSTAATPVSKTITNGGVNQTRSSRLVSIGDTLYANFAGTVTGYVGGVVTVALKRYRKAPRVR